MKKKAIVLLCLLTGIILFLTVCNNNPVVTEVADNASYFNVQLPQNALPTCTVQPDIFNTWFSAGKAAENGLVTPANSVTFGHNNNCDFYQWSERMFLWVTSPNSGGPYGSQGTVMESPLFYTVAADSAGGLQLIKHVPGIILPAVSSLQKNGPNRLPVFRNKNGQPFEVLFHKPGEKVQVKNQSKQVIELGPIEKDVNGFVVLKDKTGKAIEQPTFVSKLTHPEKVVHAFTTSKGIIFLDANGKEIDTEVDQATGNALMTQNGSLVYYITMVNNMYAYFLTASNKGYMSGSQFPTTASARDSILAFAQKMGFNPPSDPNALAIELKTSWIIADSLKNKSGYVTIDAIIPTYNTSSSKIWVPTGQKKVKLAMVGLHVVGSVAGHPEMVWATFEHASNTPNASYQYINNNKQVQTVAANKGSWLFASAAATSFNTPYMNVKGDTITAISPNTIGASNTQRLFPFGAANLQPNQEDTSASASNTEVIAINNSIRGLIPGNDIRKNYLFIGATWTFGGNAPTGDVYPSHATSGGAIGTSLLANSTMETYFQYNSTTCFFCHSNNTSLQPGALSHVYDSIHPLSLAEKAARAK